MVFCSYAQVLPLDEQRYADSLNARLQASSPDTDKARTNFLLSEYWSAKDSTQAKQYLVQGLQLSHKDPYLLAIYGYYHAHVLGIPHADEASRTYLQADSLLKAFKTKEAFLFRAKCWHNYAVLQKIKDDHKAYADIILNKALPLARQAGDSIYVGKNYLDLAIAFKNLVEFPQAEPYLLRAMDVLRHAHAPAEQLLPVYHTLSENYVLSGQNSKAKPFLDSIRILLAPFPESDAWLDYYAAIGMYLTVAEKFDESLIEIEKGITLARKLKEAYPEQRLLLQKFYALYNRKSFADARDVLLGLSGKKEFMALITNRLQLCYGLAETYVGLNSMKPAYQWLKQYAQLSDSVNSSKLISDVNALEVKFRNAENQQKIAELEAFKQKAALSASNQRLTNWLLGSLSLFLLITFAFLWYYYRNKQKLAAQKEINYHQQMKEMQQQQQLHMAQALLEGQEQERSRVARDLHDGLGGMLAAVKIKLSGHAVEETNGFHYNKLEGVIDQLDQSVHELRRIARNMMPESLLKFGLETALKDLCESMMSTEMQIEFQAFSIDSGMPMTAQVAIYRIIQEALSNAIRHAQASRIILQCSQNDKMFFITVEDNGKGFDVNKLQQHKGIGFSNIRNRVEYMKGKLEVSSTINEGTVINIELNVEG